MDGVALVSVTLLLTVDEFVTVVGTRALVALKRRP